MCSHERPPLNMRKKKSQGWWSNEWGHTCSHERPPLNPYKDGVSNEWGQNVITFWLLLLSFSSWRPLLIPQIKNGGRMSGGGVNNNGYLGGVCIYIIIYNNNMLCWCGFYLVFSLGVELFIYGGSMGRLLCLDVWAKILIKICSFFTRLTRY